MISAYLSLLDDWDCLGQAIASVLPRVDELVIVDGAYRWMTPYFKESGRDPSRSVAEVYDVLSGLGPKLRVITGIWENEPAKRMAGYEACQGRYRYRVDADEIYFFDEDRLGRFWASSYPVGEMEMPTYIAPGLVAGRAGATAPRIGFLFDSQVISARDHLSHIWLVLPRWEQRELAPPRPEFVFPEPLAFTAHLTQWRRPASAISRARFYVMNYLRERGGEDGAGITDFTSYFARTPPAIFDEILLGHSIVVMPAAADIAGVPTPLTPRQEQSFAPLYDRYLVGLAELNSRLAHQPRALACGELYQLDATLPISLPLAAPGRLAISFSLPIGVLEITLCSYYADPARNTETRLAAEIAGQSASVELPPATPGAIRRGLAISFWPEGDEKTARFWLQPRPPPAPTAETGLTPEGALRLAQALHQPGADGARLDAAARAYRLVLRHAPGCVPALAGLGRLLLRGQDAASAWPLLDQASRLAPESAEIHSDRGIAAMALARPAEALASFAAAARLAPEIPAVHLNLAQAYARLGRHQDAAAAARAALAQNPDFAAAHDHLAQVLRQLGDTEAAIAHFERAVALAPDAGPIRARLGRALAEAGRHQDAAETLRRAIATAQGDAALHNDYGTALAALGQLEAAEAQFRAAIALRPDFAVAHSNLGNTLAATSRYQEAAASYGAAIRADPELAEAHGNLGAALLELRHPRDALPHLNRALELQPALPETENARAHAQMMLGDIEAARQGFRRAAALRPDRALYYAGLAASRGLPADDPAFLAMRAMAEDGPNLPLHVQVALNFALHRCYEAQGDFDAAFTHLARGNQLRRTVIPYDEAATMGFFESLKRVFDANMLRRAPPRPAAPDLPIFILGMPRSGSTLVEQILASHPEIGAAGEVMLLPRQAEALGRGEIALPYPASALTAPAEVFAEAGDRYRRQLRARVPRGRLVTDKLPVNFLHVGLIRMMLPGAHVIHTRRDPADTCLSCFAQAFTKGLPYTNDLGELGRYYRAYAELMDHWRAVLPEAFVLDVDYQTLVGDFEQQVRRMLDFCGLAWDPACLDFHQLQRPVLTASLAQVRRPIYPDSIGRAARYGERLRPLLEALGQ
jgi:tetratricopeptide (TPR) repeat protein